MLQIQGAKKRDCCQYHFISAHIAQRGHFYNTHFFIEKMGKLVLICKKPVNMPEASIKRYYRVDREQIHFLKFILEGYDGAAVLRTIDPQEGLVVLHIGPGCQSMVDLIIRDLQRQIRVEPVESRDEYLNF